MPIRVSPLEAYQLWSETWDADPSAIVALESRWTVPWLANLHGATLLDVSCGTGRWLSYAHGQSATVFGADLSRGMLLKASQKPGLAGCLAQADASRLPFPGHCADITVCALSLAHMSPMESAFAEIARTVRPGGSLIVTDFHPDAYSRGWKRTFRGNGQLYEIEIHPYSVESLFACAGRNGLVLQNALEPAFGEPERAIFERAGKP